MEGFMLSFCHLDSRSKAKAVVGAVVNGVEFPEEHVSKDPLGFAVTRGQVGGGDAHRAVLVPILVVLETESDQKH